MTFPLIALVLVAPALSGCDRETKEAKPQLEAAPSSLPAPAVPQAARADAGTLAGEVAWDVPATWKETPARPMRKVTYEAPAAVGVAEIAVFYFGPDQGGGVEENIQRWVAQFPGLSEGSAERSEEEINGMKRVNVDIKNGTYASGMPGTPAVQRENWAMSASIVETPVGYYYFKMTGPAASVAAQKASFETLLSSIRFEKKN